MQTTFVIGNPLNMNGTEEVKDQKKHKNFIHKLKSRFNNIQIISVDERLTTVEAHKTMNFLNIDGKKKKKSIVDTISAVYILESYINKKQGMSTKTQPKGTFLFC